MTLKTRFIALILILCAGLGLGLMVMASYERTETAKILEDVSRQRSALLDRLIALSGNSLKQFSLDYSLWTEAVNFVDQAKPDPEWAKVNIDASLVNFNSQLAWILKPDGRLFYEAGHGRQPGSPLPELPPREDLVPMFRQQQFLHFFLAAADGIYEVRGAPIVPSDDITRASPPHGYLLVARLWDEAYLQTVSQLTDSQIKLAMPAVTPESAPHETGFHLFRPIKDLHGNVIRRMVVHYQSPELAQIANTDHWEAAILFGYGTLAIIIVVFFVQRWVLRPLGHISESLASGNVEPLHGLLAEKSELGRVACLVKSSFSNHDRLHAALEDRARLGRDLHDGVIQTLYATGMSLTSVRATLRHDPEAAEHLIDQTRRELNATIRELRNFIMRLEPEPEQPQNFTGAIRSLLTFMQAGREVAFTLDIDETLAGQLPMDFRAQLLQILREAASNAFRHGNCQHLEITLQPRGGGMRWEIRDDGIGFDPGVSSSRGHGLGNFRERADELNGTLDITSQPGHGTRVVFNIPLPD